MIRQAGMIGVLAACLIGGSALSSATALAAAVDDQKIARLFESSFSHENQGETDAALNDTLQIVRIDANHYVANLRAGWLYYQKQRYSDSVRFYVQATKLAPLALEPQLGLMLPLMGAARWKEAERVARRVLEQAPRSYLARTRLAHVLLSQGRYSAAETLYEGVLTDYPSDVDVMLGLGWVYVWNGRKLAARAIFERVLAIRRGNVSAIAGLQAL